jgi:hypothetical protein
LLSEDGGLTRILDIFKLAFRGAIEFISGKQASSAPLVSDSLHSDDLIHNSKESTERSRPACVFNQLSMKGTFTIMVSMLAWSTFILEFPIRTLLRSTLVEKPDPIIVTKNSPQEDPTDGKIEVIDGKKTISVLSQSKFCVLRANPVEYRTETGCLPPSQFCIAQDKYVAVKLVTGQLHAPTKILGTSSGRPLPKKFRTVFCLTKLGETERTKGILLVANVKRQSPF